MKSQWASSSVGSAGSGSVSAREKDLRVRVRVQRNALEASLAPQFVVTAVARHAKEPGPQAARGVNLVALAVEGEKHVLHDVVPGVGIASQPPNVAAQRAFQALHDHHEGPLVAGLQRAQQVALVQLLQPTLMVLVLILPVSALRHPLVPPVHPFYAQPAPLVQ